MKKNKVKVLIVEDSASMQQLLEQIINDDDFLEVIGIVSNGKQALEFIRNTPPDVITMDIIMPIMNGYDATRKIMMDSPIPIIIISGKYTKNDVSSGFEAMEAGAVSIMEKPPGINDPSFCDIARNIQKTIRSVARIKLIKPRQHLMSKQENDIGSGDSNNFSKIKAIAIGSSLGGPQALKELFSQLPSTFPLPIFLVQHIAQGFGDGFVEWINTCTPLNIVIPKEGEEPQAGTVYVAPDNLHMIITKNMKISLLDTPSVSSLKPAVSLLFSSFSQCYGSNSMGILLTGMGSDGSQELLTMKNVGAITIAQDEETCLVFGMPGSAIQLGAAKHVLPLQEIPHFLIRAFCNYTDRE